MQRKPVLAWTLGAALGIVAAGPAWAQTAPDPAADTAADTESAGAGDGAGDFEGSDQMMETGSLGQSSDTPGERPWAEGVSAEDQRAAKTLFHEGNDLLRQSLFLPAVEKYREALKIWDHPGIHFNLALALLNLDQPIAVYRSLEKAMAHGEGPIDAEKLERAQSYFELVSQQLGTIEIVCNEPDARVTLDGKPVLTGPGTYRELLRVGQHQVVATKRGYVDETLDIVLEPKEHERVDIVMYNVDDLTVSTRRWPVWMPWAVAGAGVAVLATGGVLHAGASSDFASYDKSFDERCMPGGCNDSEVPDLTSQLEGAERNQQLAVVSYIVGGAALAGGLVLAYINQPQVFRRDVKSGDVRQIAIVPVLSPDAAGVSASLRF